jgi:hypothetical protein
MVGRSTFGADFQTSVQADASTRDLSTAPTAKRGKPLLIPQTTLPAFAEPIILHDLVPLDALCDPHDPTGEASLDSIPARNVTRDVGRGGVGDSWAAPSFQQMHSKWRACF